MNCFNCDTGLWPVRAPSMGQRPMSRMKTHRFQHPSRATHKKPPLRLQPTTLWDYPSQDYGDTHQGVPGYKGATPSYIIWNLLQRYTNEKDLVVDCFAGSGTTLDVARDLK